MHYNLVYDSDSYSFATITELSLRLSTWNDYRVTRALCSFLVVIPNQCRINTVLNKLINTLSLNKPSDKSDNWSDEVSTLTGPLVDTFSELALILARLL